MWKTIGITVLVIAVLVGVGFAVLSPTGASADDAATEPVLATVSIGAIEEVVGATGEVAPESEASLVFETSGRIVAVNIAEGDEVNEGDVLVQLDDSALQDSVERSELSLESSELRLVQAQEPASEGAIAAAEASLASAQASLDKLLAGPTDEEIEQAKLQVDSARNSLWSAQASRDATAGSRSASDASVDQAEAGVLIAEVAVEQALVSQQQVLNGASAEDIAGAQALVDQAQASLDQLYEQPRAVDVAVSKASVAESELLLKQAQEALEDAQLLATMDGTVTSINATVGEQGTMNAAAVVLANTDELVLDVLLDEVDVALVAEGQTARITLDALPDEELVGEVTYVAPSATDTGSGVAYKVEMTFAANELPVRLGMTAKVDIVVKRVDDALLVPNRAITADREAGRYYVTVTDGSGTETIEIEIGLRDETYTQVTGGLEEGDQIVLQVVDIETTENSGFMPMPGSGAMQ